MACGRVGDLLRSLNVGMSNIVELLRELEDGLGLDGEHGQEEWAHISKEAHNRDRRAWMLATMMRRIPTVTSAAALNTATLWSRSWKECEHRGPWESVRSTLLSQLAKALSVSLDYRVCITVQLSLLLSAPAVLRSDLYRAGVLLLQLDDSEIDRRSLSIVGYDTHNNNVQRGKVLLSWRDASSAMAVAVLRDSPAASTEFPIRYGLLKANTRCRGNGARLEKWAREIADIPTTISTGFQEGVHIELDVNDVWSMLAAFGDKDEGRRWVSFAGRLEIAWRTRASPGGREDKYRDIEVLCGRMRGCMDSCHSKAVQAVLGATAGKNWGMMEAGHFIYALISPLWGKVYVGATGFDRPRPPMERWKEHAKMAALWKQSNGSRRYQGRSPSLYSAYNRVGIGSVIMVILDASPFGGETLGRMERHYIRAMEPVWNVSGGYASDNIPRAWMSVLSEELVVAASRILRQANPRLSAQQWVHLIAELKARGERELAAKVARMARQRNLDLRRLRTHPQVTFPCPTPSYVLRHLSYVLRKLINRLPHFQQTPQMILAKEGRACWKKSPFVEQLIAPSKPPFGKIGSCTCEENGMQKNYQGHAIVRKWQEVSACSRLSSMFGNDTLQQRSIPDVDEVWESMKSQIRSLLIASGFGEESGHGMGADESVEIVRKMMTKRIDRWRNEVPSHLQQRNIRLAILPVWKSGMVFVRLDRNPGRVVLMCIEAWRTLNSTVFSHARYQMLTVPSFTNDAEWAKDLRGRFHGFTKAKTGKMWPLRKMKGEGRPLGYWTVKQKSTLMDTLECNVKVRPIVAFHSHPLRTVLSRCGRALSMLVEAAIPFVNEGRPHHTPIWKMHEGVQRWLALLASPYGSDDGVGVRRFSGIEEFDVEDCFLNTPKDEVELAVKFWLDKVRKRGRDVQFAISKDGKNGDHMGWTDSPHHWRISGEELLAVVSWEMEHGREFVRCDGSGGMVMMMQVKGVPIGEQLSAALVELVALQRELTGDWPACIRGVPTARYRDNLFVAWSSDAVAAMGRSCGGAELARELTTMLGMPVKWEGFGVQRRVLEMHVDVSNGVRAVLGFRTDPDRQGESGDVVSWPCRSDPRTKQVLGSILLGAAAKLRLYHGQPATGFTSSWRRLVQFVRSKKYPDRWWRRRLALSAVRNGAPTVCLPRSLRTVLGNKSRQVR